MTSPIIDPETVQHTIDRLAERHGPPQADRVRRGVEQVAQRWWPEDGRAEWHFG